jgi:hypothetical protein
VWVFFAVGDEVAWIAGLGLVTWVWYVFEEARFSVSGEASAQRVIIFGAATGGQKPLLPVSGQS